MTETTRLVLKGLQRRAKLVTEIALRLQALVRLRAATAVLKVGIGHERQVGAENVADAREIRYGHGRVRTERLWNDVIVEMFAAPCSFGWISSDRPRTRFETPSIRGLNAFDDMKAELLNRDQTSAIVAMLERDAERGVRTDTSMWLVLMSTLSCTCSCNVERNTVLHAIKLKPVTEQLVDLVVA